MESHSFLTGFVRNSLLRVFTPVLDRRPAARLIRETARDQWKLIGLNALMSISQAVSEGATLGVIYLTVDTLTQRSSGNADNLVLHPMLSSIPQLSAVLEALPPGLLFFFLMGVALFLQIAQSLAAYISRLSTHYFAARCVALVTARIHQQILSFSFRCASTYRVGDLSDYVEQGPLSVALQIDYSSQIVVSFLMSLTYLSILLRLSPWLMLTALVLGSFIALIQKILLPRIRQEARKLVKIEVGIKSRIIEDIQALRLLHSSGQLDNASKLLSDRMRLLESSKRRRARLIEVTDPLSRLMPVLAFVLIASFSLFFFKDRNAGVLPNLVTFMLALQRLNTRMASIASCFNQLSDNSSRFSRLNDILDPGDKEFRRLGGLPFSTLEHEICFEHVGLRYQSDMPSALEQISFCLPRGSTLALVGGSGAGKSSIADLLIGLYKPSVGRILIDGSNLDTIDLSSWQQHLGVVSQDTFLFNATIAENIAFGSPFATRRDVERAAAQAQAASFISDLPEGFDTRVGERGYRLSGGQRQRLSLARAILRNPELLILDEATSALDSESERLVQEAIESFDSPRTMLVIAHRLSTVMKADQILVIERGRIVERGNHSELIARRGRYAELWEHQTSLSKARYSGPSPQLM